MGLVLAAELARHGISCRIIDTLTEPSPYCRATAVTSRTLEVFDDMGIVRQAIDVGLWLRGRRVVITGKPALDTIDDLSDCPYASLSIPQPETERLLTQHLQTFGILIERGVRLTGLTQDDDGVSVGLQQTDGTIEEARFRYVIGCDGAHSFVRHAAGIAFEGELIPVDFMLGDVHIDWSLPRGFSYQAIYPTPDGVPDFLVAAPLPQPNRYRVSMRAPDTLSGISPDTDHGIQSERPTPGLDVLQAKVSELVHEPVVLSDLRWSSIFRISMRLASSYQAGRLFLAGDAAHIHPPTGGQGMNTGIQDAYNLAWKLALVLKNRSPESLLASYTAERREEGAKVIERTMQASMSTSSKGFKTGRLTDTQLLVTYRNSPWVSQDTVPESTADALHAGDRAPDCSGLRGQGVGHTFRLFDVLRGITHVLLVDVRGNAQAVLDDLYQLALRFQQEFGADFGDYLRIVAISQPTDCISPAPQVSVVYDPEGVFARVYSSADGSAWLVRPDGYIGWQGARYQSAGLPSYLNNVFSPVYQFERTAERASSIREL